MNNENSEIITQLRKQRFWLIIIAICLIIIAVCLVITIPMVFDISNSLRGIKQSISGLNLDGLLDGLGKLGSLFNGDKGNVSGIGDFLGDLFSK